MITVYHMRGARGVRILWCCEEMGLPYAVKIVGFNDKPPEYAALNPANTIPVMVDGDAVIAESVAATQYLAARYGPTDLVVQPDEPDFADYLQLLWVGEAGLAAPLSASVGTHFLASGDEKDNFTRRFIHEGFHRRLKLVERQLADGREFLVGGRLTLADISVTFPIGIAAGLLRLNDLIPPSVQAYRQRLYKRDAFRRAAAHGKSD
jgi:glutathione S-transferase